MTLSIDCPVDPAVFVFRVVRPSLVDGNRRASDAATETNNRVELYGVARRENFFNIFLRFITRPIVRIIIVSRLIACLRIRNFSFKSS